MNIKKFPPVGTIQTENKSDLEQTKPSANQNSGRHSVSKDEFEAAKESTIKQLLSKHDPQNLKTKQLLSEQQQQPDAGSVPTTRRELAGICIAMKKLEPVGDCEPMTRHELAGSCIPMKKLEPVGDCEPMTRTVDRLKQQSPLIIEKRPTKPEK